MLEKNDRVKKIMFEVAKVTCIVLFVVFTCLFSASLRTVNFRSALLDLDRKQKMDNEYYTHIVVEDKKESSDYSSKYKRLLEYQRYSYSLGSFFQSYLITYDSSLKKLDFDNLDLNFEGESSSLSTTWNEAPLATVSVFSDRQAMESISLFLYKNLGTNLSGKYGAKCGAYISSDIADLLINEVDSLDDYDDILESHIIINSTNEKNSYSTTYSINNIYIVDDKFAFADPLILEEFNRFNLSNRNYLNFFKKFAMNPIITFDLSSFSNRESVVCYDVADKLGNMEYFMERIIGEDYFANDLNISIYSSVDSVYTNTDVFNSLSEKYKNKSFLPSSYVFLPLMLLSLFATLFLSFKAVSQTNSFKNAYIQLLSIIGFLILFLLSGQIALCIFGRVYSCLIIFNGYANIICLACVALIALLPLFVLRKRKL